MHWIIYCTDKPDSLALREDNIALHRAYLETAPIKVVMSGPLMDDAGEKMNGSSFWLKLTRVTMSRNSTAKTRSSA